MTCDEYSKSQKRKRNGATPAKGRLRSASSTATRQADKGPERTQETKIKRVDASGTTRPIGFGKPWLQAATGRMISKEKGIAGILSTLRSPATIQEVQILGCSLQGNPSFFPPKGRLSENCP